MTLTFTIPNLTSEPLLSRRWVQLCELVNSVRSTPVAAGQRRTDAITGLLAKPHFLIEASTLVELAIRERREVAVTSILVEGIDTDGQRYSEPAANLLLRGAASALNGLDTGPAVLGRIGLAEFARVELIDSRNSAWRNHASATAAVNYSVTRAGVDTAATALLGSTLSRGRSIDIDQLIAEARTNRRRQDGALVSAAS